MQFKKIQKINEKFDSTLENEIAKSLRIVKNRVEKIFIGDDFKSYSEYQKGSNGVLKDSNLTMLSSELRLTDPLTDYYRARFADNEYEYSYSFLIGLKDNFKEYDKSEDEPNRVLKADLTFKKYNITGNVPELIAEINKTINIADITEDLFVQLNIEADEYDDNIESPIETDMDSDNVIPENEDGEEIDSDEEIETNSQEDEEI